jgi:hypothetical protein
MMQWIVVAVILVAAWFLLPFCLPSRNAGKGRSGGFLASFADGLATALDPRKAIIVEEMEKRQNQDGEEADGDDEPLEEQNAVSLLKPSP